ncbi:MAG TPA: hypothetical protein VM261_10225 [Kofleriaceae bacterium]|nr:hypothetical protein [Kofleriaceae bacterium]
MTRARRGQAVVALAVMAQVGAALAARPPSPFPATSAPDGGGGPGTLWRAVAAAFDAASAEREPPPRPPVAVPVKWKAKRIASLDLGSALLALAAGDLDGDGKAEVVALTERHVVVLRPAAKGLGEVARAALPADPASIRPRDAVGTLVVAKGEIMARASTRGRGARWVLDGKSLRETGPLPAYPLCVDVSGELAPGRNYFGPGFGGGGDEKMSAAASTFWVLRCRDGVVDKVGRALRAQVTVEPGGGAAIAIETRCGSREPACTARREVRVENVGAAIELDDVDHDGSIELITSGAGAPGDADAVTIWSIGDGGVAKKPVFRRGFSGGVVGLGSGDIDGDGDGDVIAAVRLAGARKVDLWVLD